jgi:Fic family protein
MISNIGASTRIENARCTDLDVAWMDTVIKSEPHLEYVNKERLIKDKLSKDKERSIEEVAGYRNAFQIVVSSADDFYPLSISQVKGLHREMLKYFQGAGYHHGDFKTMPNSVQETDLSTGLRRTVLATADPGIITETAMADLLSWYNAEAKQTPWPVAVAVEFVFRFLAVHPFQDGNGRLSRLLFHAAIMASGDPGLRAGALYCAIDRTIEQSRKKYYFVLQSCSDGKFSPDPAEYSYGVFLNYIIDVLTKSAHNFHHYSAKFDHYCELSQTALKILECFRNEPEQSLSTGALIEQARAPRRTVIYSLNLLLKKDFIQRLGRGAAIRYRLVF